MLRFIYVILGNLHRVWMIPKMGYYSRHPEKYSEKFRYEYDRHCIAIMKKRGRITTNAYGINNLPEDGGYVMFANHQGKYDALGIMDSHNMPCSIVIEVSEEVKQGRKFIIFTSGGYEHRNGNYVDPFKPGCFKGAIRAKAPIVPVAIVNSWKVFDLWSLRRVVTQVFYLKPLLYDDYKDMKSNAISDLVYDRICAAVKCAEQGDFASAAIQ